MLQKVCKIKAYSVEREWGANPLGLLSVYASKLLCPSTKVGHWETEKAERKSVCFHIRRNSQDLL